MVNKNNNKNNSSNSLVFGLWPQTTINWRYVCPAVIIFLRGYRSQLGEITFLNLHRKSFYVAANALIHQMTLIVRSKRRFQLDFESGATARGCIGIGGGSDVKYRCLSGRIGWVEPPPRKLSWGKMQLKFFVKHEAKTKISVQGVSIAER